MKNYRQLNTLLSTRCPLSSRSLIELRDVATVYMSQPENEVAKAAARMTEIAGQRAKHRAVLSMTTEDRSLLILHFNDVYNIEAGSKEPVGGAARLATLVKRQRSQEPLVFFSGDALSPSLMSTFTRGIQMVPVLNALNIRAACLGNHDLDFGVQHFTALADKFNFPWLAANLLDAETGSPLAQVQKTTMLEVQGVKVGLVGLVAREWIATLPSVDPEDVVYVDYIDSARKFAAELRQQGAEVVIALTHMRLPEDQALLNAVAEIDLVLGGHDHCEHVERHPTHGNLLVKSGTDFRALTEIRLELRTDGGKSYGWDVHHVTSDVAEDPTVKAIVDEYVSSLGAALDDAIGLSDAELDGRFAKIRTEETNLGNFVCDVVREAARCDVALINSGTFRSNRVHQAEAVTKRDLTEILPMIDETVVLLLEGATLLAALENSVSQFPKLEGRFLQVSGIRFAFDPTQPPGRRVLKDSVFLTDAQAPIEMAKIYRVSTKAYLASGKDGFDMFKDAEVCQDCEISPVLPLCVRYHFMKLDVLATWKKQTDGTAALVHRFAAKLQRVLEREGGESGDVSRLAVFDRAALRYVISPRRENRIVCLSTL